MKKLLTRFVVLPVVVGIAFSASAQAATIFDNNVTNRVQPNCTIRQEYNDYTKQWTNNEVCSPRVYEVSKASVNSQVVYSSPIMNAISPAIPNSLAKYFGGSYYTVPQTIYYTQPASYYWNTPSNSYGYYTDRMYNTYYRGGPSDYTGYYDYAIDGRLNGYYGSAQAAQDDWDDYLDSQMYGGRYDISNSYGDDHGYGIGTGICHLGDDCSYSGPELDLEDAADQDYFEYRATQGGSEF